MNISHAKPDFIISSDVSSVIALAVAAIGARFVSRIFDSFLTPDEKRKAARRALVSRARHPTRSKFYGHAKCFRQRFANRRLKWVA